MGREERAEREGVREGVLHRTAELLRLQILGVFWAFWSFWASVLVASKGVVVLVCGEYMDKTETIPSMANCSLC